MAETQNSNRTSLAGRIAAEKRSAVEQKQLKNRVASAWTLTKTMLPGAPVELQIKVAQNLLLSPTSALNAMLRQAAVNAHYTRLAGDFKVKTGADLNEFVESSGSLNKEKSAVVSELKGEAKNAGEKTADDRKENGVQPPTYDEGKRTEPSEMDGKDADKGRPPSWTEGTTKDAAAAKKAEGAPEAPEPTAAESANAKGAAAKKACGKDCKGCDECKPKDKKDAAAKVVAAKAKVACGKDCKGCDSCKKDDKKDASVKVKAEDEKKDEGKPWEKDDKKEAAKSATKVKKAEDEPAPEPAAEEEAPAEESAPSEDEAPAEEPASEEAPFEEGAPEEGGEEEAPGEGEELFDEETASLKDAIEDLRDDIDVIQDAVQEELGEADEIAMPEEAIDGDAPLGDDMQFDGLGGMDDMLGGGADNGMPPDGGEELNIEQIFSDDNMSDKAAALGDGGGMMEEDFFGVNTPDNKEDLEALLDQEEGGMFSNPADFFAVEGVEDDPLARLFASSKEASESGIVKPGDLDSHFESSHGSESRDADQDHDGDIFADVFKSLKAEPRGDHRVKQDATSELKDPGKEASKKTVPAKKVAPKAAAFAPKLATHFDPLGKDVMKLAGGNLASVLFLDEEDYL